MNDFYVYAYWRMDTNTIFYIGKGHDNRWKKLNSRKPHFINIVNKIPTCVEILKDNLTEEEAFYWEEKIIEILVFEYGYSIDIKNNKGNSKPPHLTNMTWGGEGTSGMNPFKDKTQEELDEIKRRIGKSNKGREFTKEHKKRMSESKMGEKNPMYYKRGELNHLYGVRKCGKDNPRARDVICITTCKIFTTIKEGAKYYSIKNSSNIIRCCKGELKSAGKLKDGTKLTWKYLIWKHNKRYRVKKEEK